jgi:membrane protease YdiL (CAAX protease family)
VLLFIATTALVVGATAVMLTLNGRAMRTPLRVSALPYVNSQARYQLWLAAVAALVVLAAGALHPQNLRTFLAVGDVHAPANGVRLFGIAQGESWRSVGSSLALFATLATTLVVLGPHRPLLPSLPRVVPYLPWVGLFALSNSLAEELIYRIGVLVPLMGTVDPSVVTGLSALLFGAPHLRGMPSGLVGALMAGVLGWLLARSVLETQGLAWAWGIHFLQDIPIYLSFILANVHAQTTDGREAVSPAGRAPRR